MHQSRLWKHLLAVCLVAILGATALPAHGSNQNRVKEVGRLPLLGAPEIPDSTVAHSGWLILDSAFRRGYQVFEKPWETVIQSFDLDTLAPLRRVRVGGVPIPAGSGAAGPGGTHDAGEIVHAVDPIVRRLYLPLSTNQNLVIAGFPGPTPRRMVSHVLVLDEDAFDRGLPAFGAFTFAGADQRLVDYPLMGMAVSRHHTSPAEPGRLLALLASPYPVSTAPGVGTAVPGLYDHTLVQWDTGAVGCCGPAPTAPLLLPTPPPVPLPTEWQQVLVPCATAPVHSVGTSDLLVRRNFQWGILAAADAVYTGCQSAPQSGAVVRVRLDPVTGAPAPAGQGAISSAQPISDVLVDEGGGRLLVRSPVGSNTGGTTWWAFDTATPRFTGFFTATAEGGMAAGVDPGTGRFYGLNRDGLLYTDTRLEPLPPLQNVRPDLAAASYWRIAVDPVTRRFFVRRGAAWTGEPVEPFYRVFQDRIPLPG
jgi:hypothetical protein